MYKASGIAKLQSLQVECYLDSKQRSIVHLLLAQCDSRVLVPWERECASPVLDLFP